MNAPNARSLAARSGFTLIETMIVVAIIAILAMMAVPSLQAKFIREQIVEAGPLADLAKKAVAASWAITQTLPADNATAGLPQADKIVGNHVKSVRVEDGAVHVVFGNRAYAALRDKTLTFRPAVVEDAKVVPVAWVCARARVPDRMRAIGIDRTDIPTGYLPSNCL